MSKERKIDEAYVLDQFFTNPEIAKQCIDFFKKYFSFESFSKVIEPSAGDGSFYNLLPSNSVAVEIDNEICKNFPSYICKSWYDYKVEEDSLVIGNPPFGTQNSESVKFFNHAATNAKVIAFIVPMTWKKELIQSRLNKKFHFVAGFDLPKNCFYGSKHTEVKCCFQIWEKRSIDRDVVSLSKNHNDWEFLPYISKDGMLYPNKNADFVVLAYGSKSGQVSENIYRWRPKSVHFIKSNINKYELMERISNLDFNISNNSARQSSLGKGDLVKIYSDKFDK